MAKFLNFIAKSYWFIQRASYSTNVNRYTTRTHTCGQLSKSDVGHKVSLSGWIKYARFNNKILALSDSYGTTQCVLSKENLYETFKKINLHYGSVIQISGTVGLRPKGQENRDERGGDIEVIADELNVLSLARKDLPILTRQVHHRSKPSLLNRYKYRYLDLRSSYMQDALRFRSEATRILRDKLYSINFVECETPTLFSRTPGGANEFIVPSQLPDKFYSLTQSPQQLKQLLMIGGVDRYFQICRCYRDESGRGDRQPEFTQLDIELSYTSQNLVINLVDDILRDLFVKLPLDDKTKSDLMSSFDEDLAIKRIPHEEAFTKYGTDKPDIRFESFIERLGDGILGIRFSETRSIDIEEINKVVEATVTLHRSNLVVRTSISESGLEVSLESCNDNARQILGAIRVAIANYLDMNDKSIYNRRFAMLWVTDFPLFTMDKDNNMTTNHHPFTAPQLDSLHLLSKDPMLVKGQHYDLVFNGQEVAGGSIRINDSDLQNYILTKVLGFGISGFEYFIEALNSGCPPHGGIAFGLDRLLAILLGRQSIRDVMAFPKSSVGNDLMSGCPHEISQEIKQLYSIRSEEP